MSKVFIIAEIGSNFDNNLENAKKYIRSLASIGVDAVKFQTLKKKLIISPFAYVNKKVVKYPIYDIFNSAELPDDWHFELKAESENLGVEFISTPFYLEAVDLLEDVGVKTYKIASGDITFYPLLKRIGATGKNIILSTGASNDIDIKNAINLLMSKGAGKITLLHCVSNYPPQWNEMNLLSIPQMLSKFNLPIGLSDHSPGHTAAIAGVALGAKIIEKHVTFNRNLTGPDHHFAMTIEEFSEMIKQIRIVEMALGDGIKIPSEKEVLRVKRIRRGLYNSQTGEPTSNETDAIWLRPEHDVIF